jgi:hypothetical protein
MRLTVCSRGRAPSLLGIVDSSDDVAAAVGYVVERSLLDQRQIAVIMELFLWQADDADRLRRESRCSTLGGASSSRCSAVRPRGRLGRTRSSPNAAPHRYLHEPSFRPIRKDGAATQRFRRGVRIA